MQKSDISVEPDGELNLPEISARELLKQRGRDLEVQENEVVHLDPAKGQYRDSMFNVRVASFEDAQLMGMIPRKAKREAIVKAIAADDAKAYKLATRHFDPTASCACHGAEQGLSLQATYLAFRKRNNPYLAEVLSEVVGSKFEWHSPAVSALRKYAIIASTGFNLISALFTDITINRGSSLVVGRRARSMFANHIAIHRTGKLIQTGGYLRIWATSLTRFSDVPQIADLKHLETPWFVKN